MNNQRSDSLGDALLLASEVNASPDSKLAVRVAVRNRHGDFVLAGVFGQTLPDYIKQAVRRFYSAAYGGEYKSIVDSKIPRRFGLGDILALLDPESSKAEDSWLLVRLQEALPASHDATVKVQLEHFYREHLLPHVINNASWTQAETAMLIMLLYSFENPMQRIHVWFKDQLAPGIVGSLQRYQIGLYASHYDRAHTSLVFDPMLVMSLLRIAAKPNGVQLAQ